MSGQINSEAISAPSAIPGPQEPFAALLAEYPELAGDVAALTAWRDVGKYDRKSKGFERQFPSLKPNVP